MKSVMSESQSFKYPGCKDTEIRRFQFLEKTQSIRQNKEFVYFPTCILNLHILNIKFTGETLKLLIQDFQLFI